MSRRVLVTGALGYLGGRIAEHLASAPDTRLVLTTRDPARAPAIPFPHERVVALDLARPAPDDLCDGVDAIVHLAAPNEISAAEDPESAIDTTVNGTLRVLARARQAGVRRIVYASTAHVYGAPLVGHLHEGVLPRPRHPYAIAHRAAEDVVLASGLEAIVVRISNGYGRPLWAGVDRWTLLVNDLCRQAVVHGALVLRSSGRQLRDFVTLGDVARAVDHLLALPARALGDGVFDLGSDPRGPGAMSVLAMAERVRARAGVVLGREPTLALGEDGADAAPAAPLRYDSTRLAATGFRWSEAADAELDGTLDLCRRAFGLDAATAVPA
ncbi:MAG: SDR family oxidoreductase [Deltaproteobacteria bacterium]|nr:SDR family oxidoreductase [Deltaproteobacteria bacterium]